MAVNLSGPLGFIGLLGIGASTVLFYHALQRQGATRTSAIFLPATALTGVLAGAILLKEPIGALEAAAVVLVAAGTILSTRSPKARVGEAGDEEERDAHHAKRDEDAGA